MKRQNLAYYLADILIIFVVILICVPNIVHLQTLSFAQTLSCLIAVIIAATMLCLPVIFSSKNKDEDFLPDISKNLEEANERLFSLYNQFGALSKSYKQLKDDTQNTFNDAALNMQKISKKISALENEISNTKNANLGIENTNQEIAEFKSQIQEINLQIDKLNANSNDLKNAFSELMLIGENEEEFENNISSFLNEQNKTIDDTENSINEENSSFTQKASSMLEKALKQTSTENVKKIIQNNLTNNDQLENEKQSIINMTNEENPQIDEINKNDLFSFSDENSLEENASSKEQVSPDNSIESMKIIVKTSIEIGTKPFIRGYIYPLSSQEGIAMEFIEIGKWQWTFNRPINKHSPFRISIWKNDNDVSKEGWMELLPQEELELNINFKD